MPLIHVHGGAYVILSRNTLGLSRFLAVSMISLNCASFGVTLAILAIHFIYRYLAVCRPTKMHLFQWPYTSIWVVFCSEIILEWSITDIIFAGESVEVDNIIRDSMKNYYNLSTGDFVYTSSLYYRTDVTGVKRVSWPDVFFALNIIKMIGICLLIVFYCGIATYRKMSNMENTSKRTNDLQQQLFKALIVQTFIPLLTMFLPAGIMLISPICKVSFGRFEGFIILSITTYPCLDPLVVIYFVKDYRNVISNMIRCRKPILKNNAISFATVSG